MRSDKRYSEDEVRAADAIAKRACRLAARAGIYINAGQLVCDLLLAHTASPLDLEALEAADDFPMSRDVFGIRKHLDRETGALGGGFVPRHAARG